MPFCQGGRNEWLFPKFKVSQWVKSFVMNQSWIDLSRCRLLRILLLKVEFGAGWKERDTVEIFE
jgi:hypothetical protein